MTNHSLTQNVFFNTIKQVATIIFPLISFTYCSRVLGAENIGRHSFAYSVVSYFILLAALGIPSYAIREGASIRDDKTQLQVFIDEVFSINCITTLMTFIIFFITIFSFDKFIDYRIIMLIQSVTIVLTALGVDWVNSIFEDYFYLAVRYIGIQVVTIIFMFLFVNSRNDVYVYTVLTAFASSFGNVLNWGFIRKKGIRLHFTVNMNFRKHFNPIMVLFATTITSVIYLNSDVTLIGLFLSDTDVGIYTISSRIYSILKSLINAVTLVTLPHFSYMIKNKLHSEYMNELKIQFDLLCIIAFPIIVGTYFEADKILYLVSGEIFESGCNVIRILSFTILFAVAACAMAYSILIPNYKDKKFLYSTVVAAVINIVLNLYFIPTYGIEGAALTTLIAEICVCGLTMYYARPWIKFRIDFKGLSSICCGCVLIMVCCTAISRLNLNVYISFILEVVGSILLYAACLILFKNKTAIHVIKSLIHTKKS